MAKRKEKDTHPLLEKVFDNVDPKKEDAIPFTGYLMREPAPAQGQPQYFRLYARLDTGSYYRILETDIARTDAADESGEPNDPDTVWVRANAKVEFVLSAKASFLDGEITRKHLEKTVAAARAGEATLLPTAVMMVRSMMGMDC